MSRRSAMAVILACVFAPACAPRTSGDFARITVSPGRARAGDAVTLTLTNQSEHQLGYNLCAAALDRRIGDVWEQHPVPPAEACTMELRILDPGASADYRHTLPADLPEGTWRFRTGVEWPLGTQHTGLASQEFSVRS